ncbi:unnamed protein product [Trichobilharzia regenti]|nr:unnamed protein product [Trichobilharzia regenti]
MCPIYSWLLAPSEIPADSILSNGETNGELDGTPGWIDEMNTVPSYLIAPSNKVRYKFIIIKVFFVFPNE